MIGKIVARHLSPPVNLIDKFCARVIHKSYFRLWSHKPDDRRLHGALKSILSKFYNFFKIQKNTEFAFKNIKSNVEKLKESILRSDPNYNLLLNISKEVDKNIH